MIHAITSNELSRSSLVHSGLPCCIFCSRVLAFFRIEMLFLSDTNEHNENRFLFDGAEILTQTHNQYLAVGQVGLWCDGEVQLSVSSFKVTIA